MRISGSTTPPFLNRPAPASKSALQTEDATDKVDLTYKTRGPIADAAFEVGESAFKGSLEGCGLAYLSYLGHLAGPGIGLGVQIGLVALGAAVGVNSTSERLEPELGKPLSKVMGGVIGAGKTALLVGLGQGSGFETSLIGGAALGGLFGVLDTPR